MKLHHLQLQGILIITINMLNLYTHCTLAGANRAYFGRSLLTGDRHLKPGGVRVTGQRCNPQDRKEHNRWVSSISQDGQAAVITPDQDAVMSHDQDDQDVVISTKDDDEPSRPVHKV